jgi:hypothetical protein
MTRLWPVFISAVPAIPGQMEISLSFTLMGGALSHLGKIFFSAERFLYLTTQTFGE